ncbi:hypothetical protein ABT288_47720 [Streptomyces sp. NPDC001093]|uniref:hypothetical protein n=1 Tax=Streptomyces sp. NPDC001093 TaxID=3154376 RepID=UPI003319BF7F
MRAVVGVAGHLGADKAAWKRRWARLHHKLQKEGRTDLLPGRQDMPEHEALKAAAAEAEALVRTIDVPRADSRPYDSMRAARLLAGINKDRPTRTFKIGASADECWTDLTDYLKRLALLFDPRPIPTKNDGHTHLRDVLPRLAGLAELTGMSEWQDLTDQIHATYKTAEGSGWEAVDPGWSAAVRYNDEFAAFRAAAGRKASQLARAGAAHISDHPSLPPAVAPVNRHQYDPPRSDITASGAGMAVLATVVTVILVLFDVSWTTCGLVGGILVFAAVAFFISAKFRDSRD